MDAIHLSTILAYWRVEIWSDACARTAWKQVLLRLDLGLVQPSGNGIAGLLGDLELDWSLGFLLHDDGACCNLASVCDIPDEKRN